MSQRKSPRSSTIISGVISEDQRNQKYLRKQISKAIDAEIKTEIQGKKRFQTFFCKVQIF